MDDVKRLVIKRATDLGSSLTREGYHFVVNCSLLDTHVIKMRHHRNTNRIFIIGYFVTGEIKLYRNSKLRKTITLK